MNERIPVQHHIRRHITSAANNLMGIDLEERSVPAAAESIHEHLTEAQWFAKDLPPSELADTLRKSLEAGIAAAEYLADDSVFIPIGDDAPDEEEVRAELLEELRQQVNISDKVSDKLSGAYTHTHDYLEALTAVQRAQDGLAPPGSTPPRQPHPDSSPSRDPHRQHGRDHGTNLGR